MIEFIVKSTLCMGVSLFLYYILLKPDSNFTFNRFYLLTTLLLALLVPVLNFTTTYDIPVLNKINIEAINEINFETEHYIEEENIIFSDTRQFTFQKILLWIFVLGTLIMLLRFILNLTRIVRIIKNRGININGFNVVLINKYSNPYSFFNYIFISKKDYQNKSHFQYLFEHEKVHSRQLHSIDILIIESIKCFLWFNPFIWIYKNVISENHEYLADAVAIEKGYSKENYLNQIIHYSNNYADKSILISGFSFKNARSRIIMLNKTRKSLNKKILNLALTIFLSGTFFTLNSFNSKTTKPFLVVVDAGHGGKDDGSAFTTIKEKDINLSISSKLAAIDRQNNIKIILIRDEDKFLSLENRVKAINELKPDLVLSIHCNSSKDKSLNGTEVYYSDKRGFKNQLHNYSKTILTGLLEDVSKNGEIKTANYYIFRYSESPAILLQVGFLSNNNDLSLLNNMDYHDKIAYAIYKGLEKVSNNF